jgi:hypothetical protein
MSYQPSAGLPRIQRWAGLSAVAAVLVFVIGNALWAFEQPAQDASGPELLAFYGDLSGRIEVGALLSLISIALFVVFAGAFRAVLTELDGDELYANIAFGGALLGLAAGIGAETINMAAAQRAGDEALTEPLALALFDISYVLGSYAAGIGFGLLTVATGAVALRTRALLPPWLAAVAVGIGIASITPLFGYTLGASTVVPGGAIVLVVGISLLRGSAMRELPARP